MTRFSHSSVSRQLSQEQKVINELGKRGTSRVNDEGGRPAIDLPEMIRLKAESRHGLDIMSQHDPAISESIVGPSESSFL